MRWRWLLGVATTVVAVAGHGCGSEPSAPASTGALGYIGCSNTAQAVEGYHDLGGSRFWPGTLEYGGATVVAWANGIGDPGDPYWPVFEAELDADPATTFWVQVCAHPDQDDAKVDESVRSIIDEIRRLVPGATVYVSPFHGFVAPHVCDLVGADPEVRSAAIADALVGDGVAARGPDFPAVRSTVPGDNDNETETDGCHLNRRGRQTVGRALLDFPAFAG